MQGQSVVLKKGRTGTVFFITDDGCLISNYHVANNWEGRHVAVPNFRDADTASLPVLRLLFGRAALLRRPNIMAVQQHRPTTGILMAEHLIVLFFDSLCSANCLDIRLFRPVARLSLLWEMISQTIKMVSQGRKMVSQTIKTVSQGRKMLSQPCAVIFIPCAVIFLVRPSVAKVGKRFP